MTQAPSALPRATVAGVRAQIAAGDVAAARPAFEALRARLGPATDVLVTDGLLHEAEGDLEASLASFEQALASAPGSVHANAHLARILMRLERPDQAEAAAMATLVLDGANAHGLMALAYAYAAAGRLEERLNVVRRLAASPGAGAAEAWKAIDELAAAHRWAALLQVLDERGGALPPGRVCGQRVEALLELGRQRDALACIVAAHLAGHVKPREMVDRLMARRVFAVAAAFVQQCLEGRSGGARARAAVLTAARRTCDGTTLEASPFAFADAVRALEILLPDRAVLNKAVARSAAFLVKQARVHLARGEFSLATDHLIRAGRLTPTDRTTLEMLADAASRAGRVHRHHDTLLRIHWAYPSTQSLMPAVRGAISGRHWDTVGELLSRAEGGGLISSTDPEAADVRSRLRGHFEDLVRGGDGEGALALVAGLRPWMTASDWPAALIARLLAATKRRLRSPRTAADGAAFGRISALYLGVYPDDVDVTRLLARLHLRHRRFAEAAEILVGVVRDDPHVARDWLDLAQARNELGEAAECDACTARALVIAPTSVPAERLAQFWARMSPA